MARLRLSVAEAHRLWEGEKATPLDVVDADAYEHTEDRIQGAVRMDPSEVKRRFNELPKDRPVIAYCT